MFLSYTRGTRDIILMYLRPSLACDIFCRVKKKSKRSFPIYNNNNLPPDTIKTDEGKIIEVFNSKKEFKTEKEMCDYIELNMKLFVEDILYDELISYQREFTLKTKRRMFPNKGTPNPRIDFLIIGRHGRYAIEVKNPTQTYTELSRSIGQMMLYEMLFEQINMPAKMYMVSSRHSIVFIEMINRFKLNYKYILLGKNVSAEYRGQEEKKQI